MKCRSCRHVFVLFGVLRLLGVFPYKWKYHLDGKLEVRRSVWATVFSCVLVLSLVSLSMMCVVNSPDYHMGVTSTVSTHIVNYMTYLISAVFFPYLAFRSSKLANILRRMDETSFPLRQRIVGWEDSVQILCGLGITTALCYATSSAYVGVITNPGAKTSVLYHLPTIFCDFMIETTALTLSLLLYFTLKILSLQGEAAVLAFGSVASGRSPGRWAIPKHPAHLRADSDFIELERRRDESSPPSVRGASRYLLSLDDAVLEVVDYAGPPAAMILLTSSSNATVMLYLTTIKISYYYLAFILLKILSVVQIAFIPDAFCCKREQTLRWIRRLLSTRTVSVSTEVNQQDSAVASSVVTYLVIAFQFSFSETPNTQAGNCTIRDLL
ncbi:uncharacterized protein [Panulirus ornatus]|uniref:uncharacterized protein isoform X2 n=1 Tax=Panulirus ornatus TaxID=150431 RepID=UPI003A853CF5